MTKQGNPFKQFMSYTGQKGFDKYYFTLSKKEVFKSTGQKDDAGDEIGVKVIKYVVDKTDIAQFVAIDANNCGVYPMLKQLVRLGQDLPVASFNEGVVDTTMLPNDLIEAGQFADKLKAAYNKVPQDLTKGQDIETFLKNINDDAIKAYIDSVISKKFSNVSNEAIVNETKDGDK